VGQSLHTESPFEFTDMSVKEPYDSGWKEKVRTRIRRSDGIIVLVSKTVLTLAAKPGKLVVPKKKETDFSNLGLQRRQNYSRRCQHRRLDLGTIEKFIDSL